MTNFFLEPFTNPSVEPLTLAETKLFLKIDDINDDSLITDLIQAAREYAEKYLRISIINRQWRIAFDDYISCKTYLSMGKITAIIRVTKIDEVGVATDISASKYYINAAKDTLILDEVILSHQIEIIYQAGFGANNTDIPEPLRKAMLIHISSLYDDRNNDIPSMVKALYAPYRRVSL